MSRDAAVPGADAAGAGGAGGAPGPVTRAAYLEVLYRLVDHLVSAQITTPSDPNFGAIVSPSLNPENKPIHSRAAEAVYPLAVAFKHRGEARYAEAAVRLGNWLVKIQNGAGAWIEEWPDTSGWDGTTADQLISLAGAYPLLEGRLSAEEKGRWQAAITRSADWVVANFPKGNINYQPTGAVALVLSHKAVPAGKAGWLTKAASLMQETISAIGPDGFLLGEGDGVDLGYNIAQSIGFVAMYGLLTGSAMHVEAAKKLLETHGRFMYPNGAIDNSWGTRSYKWMLESGTKTAPGIYFTYGLLAHVDPAANRGAQLALGFLKDHFLAAEGWVVYGPHAHEHAGSNPPSNYSTFARAQSIATVVELGTESATLAPIAAEKKHWITTSPSIRTAVLRSDKVMATISAYRANGRYPRESVVRGGSATVVWYEGYGPTGFLQLSSPTRYTRAEAKHMPTEGPLLSLTPRIETTTGTYAANVLDENASLASEGTPEAPVVTTAGVLRTLAGMASAVTFRWTHRFGPDSYTKEAQVSSGRGIQIVEPFVDLPGNDYTVVGSDTFRIQTAAAGTWELKVEMSSGPYRLEAGKDRAQYWCPFPGVEGYPLAILLEGEAAGPRTVRYTIRRLP
jgi:hypothetical protein